MKKIRQGIKRPLQRAFSWASVLPLDRRPRTVADLDSLEPRSIVASRTDRIGDLLLASPLLWALHRRWPKARLVMIAGLKNRAVLAGLPFVERGPVFRRDPLGWAEQAWFLSRESFDLCVSLWTESMAGVWIAAWSRAPVRMTVNVTKTEYLTKTEPAFNLILGAGDAHEATRYCHAAAILGFPPEEIRPIFIIPADAERRAAEVLPDLLPRNGAPLVGFQIPHRSTRRYTVRAWPVEKVVALVRQLAAAGCRVVLCGTGSERTEAEYVRSQVPQAVLAPAVPLAVFAAVQRRFDLFISQFTGTLHLADAVGIPTVSYGLDEQVDRWGLIGPQHRSIRAARVAEIPVEMLLEAARSALASRHG